MVSETDSPAAPLVVSDEGAFAELTKRLRAAPRIAVDTEAASYHRYFDRIYLIQVSSATETAVIDPLGVSDLTAFGRILANSKVELVFHDADYDLRVLDRDYGFHATRLFDTRIAAQLLGEPGVGLGALLEKFFGVKLDKKMQRADWSRRPLTPEMIAYASSDTRYLLDLRDELARSLEDAGRMAWAVEEFKRLEAVRWSPPNADGPAFLRVKGAKVLKPRGLAILKSVFAWRDRQAKKLDRAPFRVLGNEAMMALARAAPQSRAAMGKVKGVPPSVSRRYGDDLLQAVRKGVETPEAKLPRVPRGRRPKVDPAAEVRFERLKLLRNKRAKALGIEPGVLCPNGTLNSIARVTTPVSDGSPMMDAIPELRRWQWGALGEGEVLAVLDGTPRPAARAAADKNG